jgi:hypothetical protein
MGLPHRALRRLAILQPQTRNRCPQDTQVNTCWYCRSSLVNSLSETKQASQGQHTAADLQAKRAPTMDALRPMCTASPPNPYPHLLGLGRHRCHTLLPSAAAYLRSLHHPGICVSVAPKMRKRPTSCKADRCKTAGFELKHCAASRCLCQWKQHTLQQC